MVTSPVSRALATAALLVMTAAVVPARQDPPPALAAALVGSWAGTLEYRDYRSDGRVTLPTKLAVVAEAPDAVRFEYTYDEGGGRLVTSRDRITIKSTPATYRVQSGDGKYDNTFDAQGLTSVRDGAGTVTLSGRGRENDQDVELRITITLTPAALTMLRESRRPNEEWRFRNRYSFSRVQ